MCKRMIHPVHELLYLKKKYLVFPVILAVLVVHLVQDCQVHHLLQVHLFLLEIQVGP